MKIGSKIKAFFIKSLAVLNYAEGIIHVIVASIGLWGCIAIKVFDIRIVAPVVENYIFGIFSVLTGVVMIRMIRKNKKQKYVKPLFSRIEKDNRENRPYSPICINCAAGELPGIGCILDKNRGCWITRRQVNKYTVWQKDW